MLCEFICEHNLPIATADLAGKLLNVIFPDSKTAKKYFGSQTNTTRISSWTVAKESITNLKLTLSSSYSGSQTKTTNILLGIWLKNQYLI